MPLPQVPCFSIQIPAYFLCTNVLNITTVIPGKSTTEINHNFAPGDFVEVCEGELIHLQGKIVKVDGNKVIMMPKHEDLKVRG